MAELTKSEIDTLGEIANISLGNAATTLSLMVNHTVNITTPYVSFVKRDEALKDYENTCVFVQIHYVKGLNGNNVFILKERDVLCLTDLMMGGSGINTECELGELQLSAMSEAMNQMMGTSATSMATMLDIPVDISTPDVCAVNVNDSDAFDKVFNEAGDDFVKVRFRMDIEGLIDSVMVQIYPVEFAKEMCEKFLINKKEN